MATRVMSEWPRDTREGVGKNKPEGVGAAIRMMRKTRVREDDAFPAIDFGRTVGNAEFTEARTCWFGLKSKRASG